MLKELIVRHVITFHTSLTGRLGRKHMFSADLVMFWILYCELTFQLKDWLSRPMKSLPLNQSGRADSGNTAIQTIVDDN